MTEAGSRWLAIFRRKFLSLASAAIVGPFLPRPAMALQGGAMYGRIGKILAACGQRDALAAILLGSSQAMPGCLSYVIATDATDPDALWITEVWDSAASHKKSLTLPAVQSAIAKGRPLIAGFGSTVETTPIGGYGLQKPASLEGPGRG